LDLGPQIDQGWISGDATEQMEKMKYFGWLWETEDAVDVKVATTADDAAVKYDLWAAGGNDPINSNSRVMEKARGTIHNLTVHVDVVVSQGVKGGSTVVAKLPRHSPE